MDRTMLRGKRLLKHCKGANTTTNEYGEDDNRIYCYGRVDASTEELIKECKECRANIIHIKKP